MAGARASSGTTKPGGASGAAGARDGKVDPKDRTALAARLYGQTGDQAQTEAALRELGSNAGEAKRLAAAAAGKNDQPATPPVAPPKGGDDGPPANNPISQLAKSKPPVQVSPTLKPPRKLSAADGGGFLLGLLLFALGQSYLRYGAPGVTSWFAAKFLNKPNASIVAAEGKRGIVAKKHAQLTTPGAGAAPPSFLTGKAPKGTPTVPPTERFGR